MCYPFISIITTGLGNNPWKDVLFISFCRGKRRLKSKLIYLWSFSWHMKRRTQIQTCLALQRIHSLSEGHLTDPPPEWCCCTCGTSCPQLELQSCRIADNLEAVYTEMVFSATEWTRQPRKGKGSIKGSRKEKNQKRDKERVRSKKKVRSQEKDDPGLMETMINKDLNGNWDQKGRGSQDSTSHKEVKKDEDEDQESTIWLAAPFGWRHSLKEDSTEQFHGERKAYRGMYAWWESWSEPKTWSHPRQSFQNFPDGRQLLGIFIKKYEFPSLVPVPPVRITREESLESSPKDSSFF